MEQQQRLDEEARNRTSTSRFTAKTDGVEDSLKRSTYGLVQLETFKQTRQALEAASNSTAQPIKLKPKKSSSKKTKPTLSFDQDEEEEDDRVKKKPKMAKNPNIDTTFLPDRDRDQLELELKQQLKQEWLQLQQKSKEEDIDIHYSYYDGHGSRNMVTVKKGDTIATFLDKVRQQVPALRSTITSNLLYIKEDLIIGHHYTFYDFILNKYRGKSGPLFNFDVHDDVRLLADATIEKNESHAGKVVEASYYARQKHVHPLNRWEVFNPEIVRDKYTIH